MFTMMFEEPLVVTADHVYAFLAVLSGALVLSSFIWIHDRHPVRNMVVDAIVILATFWKVNYDNVHDITFNLMMDTLIAIAGGVDFGISFQCWIDRIDGKKE